jgi:hypothetical protein
MSAVVDIEAAIAASREYVKAQDYIRRATAWYSQVIAAVVCAIVLIPWMGTPGVTLTVFVLLSAGCGCMYVGDGLSNHGRAAAERAIALHEQAVSEP